MWKTHLEWQRRGHPASNTAPWGYIQHYAALGPPKNRPSRCWMRAARCLAPLRGLRVPPRCVPTDCPERQLQCGEAKTRGATSTPADFLGMFVGKNKTAVVSVRLCWGCLRGLSRRDGGARRGAELGRGSDAARAHQRLFSGLAFPHWKKDKYRFPFAAASGRACYWS